LQTLAKLTGIPLKELADPTPNLEAVQLLVKRFDWFFDDFLMRPEMIEERDGKLTGELLVKALHKVLNRCAGGAPVNLISTYDKRRKSG
jgi:hypothetical protein